MEIEVHSPYGTKLGRGPIITGRNWRSRPRMNKIGAFSFEMPLNDPRLLLDSGLPLLAQKRYVRCYGMVDASRTELGKPGIIDSVIKEMDANGVPTGMLRVSGRDLLAELKDINIHELSLIDTDTRIPDSVQYYDGTTTNYIDMTDAYNDNPADGVETPADDEDWFYFGDADPFDIVTLDLGANLNVDPNGWTLEYSIGNGIGDYNSGSVVSDGTKVDGASFAQDGAIRWERQEDWATDTVNNVADKYWIRIAYKEDMSGDVSVNEITITEELPTATALADWLAYTDAAAGTPIDDLGWDFWATHQATENTVFLILRDVSAFEALTMIAEQTGENFRLGTGRLIDWLQNDKTASGIRATNVSDGIAAEDNEAICLITNLAETEDSYEMISRVYPQGGGRGSTRITLSECTVDVPGDDYAGYTLSISANYLKKDSTESDYGRRIETSKFWPNIVSPSWAASRDVSASDALFKLAYEYLERHCTPQTSYRFSVVKLDAAVEVGETIQLTYWQTVEGTAVWNLGITAALHLWVLEITHAVDDAGTRVVAMQVATIDAWPSSDAGKVRDAVKQIKAMQSTDGPISAEQLTLETITQVFEGATAHTQLTDVTADQHHTGLIDLDGDSGTAVPDADDTITIAGGDGLVSSGAGNTVTLRVDVSDFAGTNLEDDGSENLRIKASAAGDGLQGGAGSALAVDVSDFAGTNLEDDGSENLRIAATAAGAGLTGGGAAVLAVGAGTGITVNANDVQVNLSYAFTWAALHTFNAGIDIDGTLEFQGAESITTTAGNLTLLPVGDLILDPTGLDVNPAASYEINLGSSTKEYLTLHVAELWASKFVIEERIVTIGGSIIVAPATELVEAHNTTIGNLVVKHNQMRKGDTAILKDVGKVEFVLITSWDIAAVDIGNEVFDVVGDVTGVFAGGAKFTIDGSTGNDGEWTVASSTFADPNTEITVDEDITDDTVDGYVAYVGDQSGEHFRYRGTRNRDGSGGNLWYAGDPVVNTGVAGDGFMDIYSLSGVVPGSTEGPTIVGNVRNSATYNDWSEHWAIGNLNGLYGYGSTTYGVAFGEYSATKAYITIDSTNGIRMMTNNVLMGQWQPGGDVIFGEVATNKGNMFWDQSAGRVNFRGGTDGLVVGVYLDTTGAITAGAGAVAIDADGINITPGAVFGLGATSYGFLTGATEIGGMYGYHNAPGTINSIGLRANEIADYDAQIDVTADAPATFDAVIFLSAISGPAANRTSMFLTSDSDAGTPSHITFYVDNTLLLSLTGTTMTMAGGLNIGTGAGADTGDIALAGGSWVGITGNEIITWDAAGTITVTGADFHVFKTGVDSTLEIKGTYPILLLQSENDTRYGRIEWWKDTGPTRGAYLGWGTPGTDIQFVLENGNDLVIKGGNLIPDGNKALDLGLNGTAWDDCWADDFQNEPDLYLMDSRKNRGGQVVVVDDLAVLCALKTSGEYDERSGMPLIDDYSLPNWVFTRDKKTGETLYQEDGKPSGISVKMVTGLSWGAIRQLNGYRLTADAEREAIRARLDDIERRG